MEKRYVGVIKAGSLVKITGDPESVREIAATDMAQEIRRLEAENAHLRAQVASLRAGNLDRWNDIMSALERRTRLVPRWMRTVYGCAVVMLGAVMVGLRRFVR